MIDRAAPTTWLRRTAVAAAILVPFAFAALFVGAAGSPEEASARVPAALVNQDELIYQSAEDGTRTPVFAGRQLVTELTADRSFDWNITNAEEADRALAAGEVHAVLTIPQDFSRSVLSLSGDHPRQATLGIRTDDAHSYLTGVLAETVGATMSTTFGKEVTTQYITGLFSGVAELGTALGTAADGAGQLSAGVTDLGGGLGELAAGVASSRSGADSLAGGVADYTSGVDSLSVGLGQLSSGAGELGDLSVGVGAYTGQLSQLAAALAAASADLNTAMALDPTSVETRTAAATVNAISSQLSAAAAGGTVLADSASAGIAEVQAGISRSAAGAAQLADGSASLRSGAGSLASGLGGLASGAQSAASGADSLAVGAAELATGLNDGAARIPATDAAAQATAAEVAADPVEMTVSRDNELGETGQAIAAFIVPLGLWMGAFAVFLVLRPVPSRMLGSTARTSALLGSGLVRAGLATAAQAVLLIALLHLGVGVPWDRLPATAGLALLTAAAFTAFHHLLVTAFGRAGLVVSLLAIAIQVTSSGGLYPIDMLAQPYQLVSPLLPLSHAVTGMQTILAGGAVGAVLASALVLVAFGLGSVLLSAVALQRVRRTAGLWPLPAT